ncbi:MAG TPA: hypothetical protein VGN80_01315 [Devosiaceae bacterium]|jgi:hypothetical protein|nr:hypothetical protein [Devosiaceae bacterium]
MKPLDQLDAAETGHWLLEMKRSLAAHAASLPGSSNPWEIRAAMNTHLLLLREMAALRPERREEIESLIGKYERK